MYKFVSSKKMQPGSDPAAMAHNMTHARRGHAVRGEALQRHPGRRDRRLGHAARDRGRSRGTGTWIPLLRSRSRRQRRVAGRRYVRPGGRGVHPVRRRQGRRHEDGPPGGLRGQPQDRQGLRRADQQRRARRTGRSRRPTPRTRATTTRTGRSSRSPTTTPAPSFTWDLLLVCGDPAAADTYYGGFDKSKVSPISCPDNLAFDSHGNLWISTDGNALDSNDGLFAVALDGPNRGETKQFLTVPLGAETCGPIVTDDLVTVSRPAPRRARRQQHRRPPVALARGRQRHRSPVGRGGVEGRREYRRLSPTCTGLRVVTFPTSASVSNCSRSTPPTTATFATRCAAARTSASTSSSTGTTSSRSTATPTVRTTSAGRCWAPGPSRPRASRSARWSPATPTATPNCSPTWPAPSTTSPAAG